MTNSDNQREITTSRINEEAGTLFVVATPIGNLDDITQRALSVLSSVDIIAAEDTRHTNKLLSHFSIKAKVVAVHDHNEKQKAIELVTWLEQGLNVALVSDAGTPLISDPGYAVVNLCRESRAKVSPIPGACAAIAAVSCSGLPTDRFQFIGFTPAKSKARQAFFLNAYDSGMTSIMYESTHRIMASLNDLKEVLGASQKVVLAKELTKSYETFFSGSTSELIDFLTEDTARQKGEIVLMLPGKQADKNTISPEAIKLIQLLQAEMPLKKACGIAAEYFDLKKNALYKAMLEQE